MTVATMKRHRIFLTSFPMFCFYLARSFVRSFIYSVCSFVYPIAITSPLKHWNCFSFYVFYSLPYTMIILCQRCYYIGHGCFESILLDFPHSLFSCLFGLPETKYRINVCSVLQIHPDEK